MRPAYGQERLTHDDQAAYGNVGIYAYEYQSNKQYNVVSEEQATDTYQIGTLEADRLYEYDTLDRLRAARMTDSPDWNEVERRWSDWTEVDDLGNWLEFSYRLMRDSLRVRRSIHAKIPSRLTREFLRARRPARLLFQDIIVNGEVREA